MDLYKRLRTKAVLHRAWARVRASGLSSTSKKTVHDTRQFEVDWFNNLQKLSKQLRLETFVFTGEKGITLPKGNGKTDVRPLVISPICNRVVRRAILEVLQGYGEETDSPYHSWAGVQAIRHRWAGVQAVRDIMATPTSIGGIPKRGVPHGLALIRKAIQNGNHWFVRSDIKGFFTRIPKGDVNAFIRDAVNDKKFADLFERALATNLENEEELEERKLFTLFPDPEIGVAQGSALSALAGNISLRKFDERMNCRDIHCIRYIDDFILLGPSEAKVLAAFKSAGKMLNSMEMNVYDLSDTEARKAGKVDAGNIYSGTDVLGYRVSGMSCQPCRAARRKLLEKLDAVVKDGKHEMRAAAKGNASSHLRRYHQSMVLLHKTVWGWSQSFKYTTAKHVFEHLDAEVDKRILCLRKEAEKLIPAGDAITHRRVMGIHLLADTGEHMLPAASLST
ncbi:reverse transcriptase domain-containing protein [Rhodospirillaceae bacterium SYSU D60014]|uniref:reverse transcriptase domain-containing protein n=1 Tax=Virgifigura deserti TaxID=2268457 RepID=UPI0013C51C03